MSGAKSRRKGHSWELQVAKLFNELGYNCVTSRSESRRLDDAGVDLCYTDPFAVQCKNTAKAPNFHDVLDSMPQGGDINLVFHKRPRRGSVVVMRDEDFVRLVKLMIDSGAIRMGGE